MIRSATAEYLSQLGLPSALCPQPAMPVRPFTLALLAPLLLAGCLAQRASTGVDDVPGGPMPPGVPNYVYGTWDYTMTAPDGSTLTGLLTIAEDGTGRFTTSTGTDAPLATQDVSVTAPTFILAGTVQADEPLSLSLAGSVEADRMTAEATLDGTAYALEATRLRE